MLDGGEMYVTLKESGGRINLDTVLADSCFDITNKIPRQFSKNEAKHTGRSQRISVRTAHRNQPITERRLD